MTNGTVVLVPGAWTGSWVWRSVAPLLRARRLNVSAVTLTGLGERRDDATPDTSLSTHIKDLVAHIEMEDLRDVTLVGWSYAGLVVTGAADAIPDRVTHLTYLDAFVPEDGKAMVDYLAPEIRAGHEARASSNTPIPPLPLGRFGVTEPTLVEFIAPRLANQPWRTFFEPIRLTGAAARIPSSYILCNVAKRQHFEDAYRRMGAAGAQVEVIEANHFCMLGEPEVTADSIARSMAGATSRHRGG